MIGNRWGTRLDRVSLFHMCLAAKCFDLATARADLLCPVALWREGEARWLTSGRFVGRYGWARTADWLMMHQSPRLNHAEVHDTAPRACCDLEVVFDSKLSNRDLGCLTHPHTSGVLIYYPT